MLGISLVLILRGFYLQNAGFLLAKRGVSICKTRGFYLQNAGFLFTKTRNVSL